MRSFLLVMTNSTPGDEAEFNKWYQEVHLKEVCEVPGIVAAQRFELTDAQISDEERPHQFLAIYEIEGDPKKAFDLLQASSPEMNISPTLDAATAFTAHYSPIGERHGA